MKTKDISTKKETMLNLRKLKVWSKSTVPAHIRSPRLPSTLSPLTLTQLVSVTIPSKVLLRTKKVPKPMAFHGWSQSFKNPVASSADGMLAIPDLAKFGRSD